VNPALSEQKSELKFSAFLAREGGGRGRDPPGALIIPVLDDDSDIGFQRRPWLLFLRHCKVRFWEWKYYQFLKRWHLPPSRFVASSGYK
jgi:hypothetical protein